MNALYVCRVDFLFPFVTGLAELKGHGKIGKMKRKKDSGLAYLLMLCRNVTKFFRVCICASQSPCELCY